MSFDLVGEPILVHEFSTPVRTESGEVLVVAAYGQARSDGTWIGWLTFTPRGKSSGAVLRTGHETTQPSRADLAYWASGLDPVYLEGALQRAS
jgi:hypothetical protein